MMLGNLKFSHSMMSLKIRMVHKILIGAIVVGIGSIVGMSVGASASAPVLPNQFHIHDVNVSANATDATIQAAINCASAAGGGTVTLEKGSYSIKKPIYLKSNVTIAGAGKGNTVLQIDANLGANGALTSNNSNPAENIIIKNLTVDGVAATEPDKASSHEKITNYGILLDGSSYVNDKVLFDNIEIKNTNMGLHIKGSSNVTVQNSEFHDNGGSIDYWHNVYLRRVTNVLIQNCDIYKSNSGNGINISYSDHVTVDSSKIYDNYFRGVRVAVGSYVDVTNNEVHGNKTGDGIIYNSEESGVTNFRIINNTVSNNGGYGIFINVACSDGEVASNVNENGNKHGYILNKGKNISVN
ncbi:right-handed parallel beta-helix repeat-containing protein [Paenibacillus sp. Aloe-11]|uniref:right-handed parallel beta-helix repeat-containing protein n=1 Tax=Paenibacillus sp. Aloe-11 TaxID=1050222 RepID=UPI000309EF91|nr:right-handed parallel beta-helix repeat-containing protein [Paenibacillus sp. Aloe-11]